MPRRKSSIVVPVATDCGAEAPQEPKSFLRIHITDRQLEILEWVSRGKSSRDIGSILQLSRKTVDHQIEKACDGLEVRTRFQAVLKALDLGLIARA